MKHSIRTFDKILINIVFTSAAIKKDSMKNCYELKICTRYKVVSEGFDSTPRYSFRDQDMIIIIK